MVRFLKFCIVGGSGVGVNLGILYLLTDIIGCYYMASAVIAVIVAATNNYILNHLWTFRDKRENNKNVVWGWVKYLISVGIAEAVYLGLLYALTEWLGLWYMLSAGIALVASGCLRYFMVAKAIWKVESPWALKSG